MKQAIILMGLPLAGKSTWIKENIDFKKYSLISADDIKEKHPDYDPNKAEALHIYSVKKAEALMMDYSIKGTDIVFDSGSINNNYSKRIIKNLKEKGYSIKLVHVKTPYTICIERGNDRERKVPEKAIKLKAIKEKAQFYKLKELVDEVEIVNYFTNKHIFIDMDGVIAALSTLPIFNNEIDFVNGEVHKYLEPVTPLINKLKALELTGKATLYILSATPNSFSQKQKHDWLDEHFNLPLEKRFFVNQGKHKAEMLENLSTYLKIEKKDMLMLDDIHATLYKVKDRNINSMHVSEFLIHKF